MLGCSLAGDTGCCLRGGGGRGVVILISAAVGRSSPPTEGRGYWCGHAAAKWRLASRRHSWRRPTTLYGQSHVPVTAKKRILY